MSGDMIDPFQNGTQDYLLNKRSSVRPTQLQVKSYLVNPNDEDSRTALAALKTGIRSKFVGRDRENITIFNWNHGHGVQNRKNSLNWISDLGFKQTILGYYGTLTNVTEWRRALNELGNEGTEAANSVNGFTYVSFSRTSDNDRSYDDLGDAACAWGSRWGEGIKNNGCAQLEGPNEDLGAECLLVIDPERPELGSF